MDANNPVRVIYSTSADVYANLAAEDALLDDAAAEAPVIFIYRNDDAVVIGKNQNPWRECAVSRLGPRGVAVARRITGGGTVYHDAGNLNLALIMPRERYRRDGVMQAWVDGLARAGVRAEVTGKTNLAAGGLKISGHAFCYRRDKVLHHGTLLVRSNLEKLRAALVPDLPELVTRAVASVPMPVANLDVADETSLAEALIASVAAVAGKRGSPETEHIDPNALPGLADRTTRMRSWEWLYGATPDFEFGRDGQTIHVHRGLLVSGVGAGSRFSLSGQMRPA